jgi:tetratricopeptide (TPR) repeat protein
MAFARSDRVEEVGIMPTDEDDVAQLLDAARAAARSPKATSAPVTPPADEVGDFLAQARTKTPGAPPRARTAAPSGATAKRPTGLLVAGGIAIVAALLVAAYALGHSSGASTAGPGTATVAPSSGQVDQAQVDALLQRIASDPKDTDSLQSLGNIYYDANDFASALTYYEKIAVLTPKKDVSWIAVAAAAFQSGQRQRAFDAWNTALDLNPNNIEAHYGLGHYYTSQVPPDNAKARTEWEKVIAIDPTSPLAKDVKAQLPSLASSGASPGATTP